jgi:hypothetical protein
MRNDICVYLSGPITPKNGFLAEENAIAGVRVQLELLRRGIPSFCPQVFGAFPSAWTLVPYERWMEYSYTLIDKSTHVLLLPRWETSGGAALEIAYATKQGKPIGVWADSPTWLKGANDGDEVRM